MAFRFAKQTFDLLSIHGGLPIGVCLHQALCIVVRFLIDIALYPTLPAGGALRLQRTLAAVTTLGDLFEGGAVMNRAGCFQLLAAGTDIEIADGVVGKLVTGEYAIRRHFGLIPHRNVRDDVTLDQLPQ